MSEEKPDKGLVALTGCLALAGVLPFVIVFAFVGGIIQAWALDVTWHWFIEPLGVRDITFIQALGISIVLAVILNRARPSDDRKAGQVFKDWALHLVAYPLLVLMGWIIQLFL